MEAAGARPLIPAVKGIESIEYLTNDSIMKMTELPESMVIIGGGVIGTEYAGIFSALGVEVSLVDGRERLLPFVAAVVLAVEKEAGLIRVEWGSDW